jgi:3-methyladenine DNA glycosylase AlkD
MAIRKQKLAGPVLRTKAVVAQLKRLASKSVRAGMARYAIPSDNAFGVSVGTLQKVSKRLGKDHELALALWQTGHFEARMLACFVGEPDRITTAQMDRWCRDFDSWAICDHACFHLFDRTPHAFRKVEQWAKKRGEFQKRAAFALLASLALHDKQSGDEPFATCLPLIERAATDERNFVKKGVSWALRGVGRRSSALHAAAIELAKRLAASAEPAPRWIGKDALSDLQKPAVVKRLAARQ